jgi:hypothetical protein
MTGVGKNNGRRSEPRLRLLCVGAGRDGTLSISRMFGECFDREGAGRQVMHEYAAREFGAAFAGHIETGDPAYMAEIRRLIAECPFDCIVGNGYAPILPLFREICGPDLALLHIRRLDHVAAIDSLTANCEYFPAAYGYYSSSPKAIWKRIAAFHFGEMTRDQWHALPLREKIGWLYDKTHALIEGNASLFSHAAEINTEALNGETARRMIAALAGDPSLIPASVHVNSQAFVADLPRDRRSRMQWLMGRFDLVRAATDDVYPLEYFLNAFIAWTGYQLRRSEQIGPDDHRTDVELAATLARAAAELREAQRLVGLLEQTRISQRPSDETRRHPVRSGRA